MDISVNQADLKSIQKTLAGIKNGYKNVVVTSINKTAKTIKVQARARIGNELNLKSKRIGEDIRVEKANYQKMSGAVIVSKTRVGLIQFSAKQNNKGVRVKVFKKQSGRLIKHAFIAQGRNSTTQHVFWRKNWQPGTKFQVGKKTKKVPWQKMPDKYRIPLTRLTGPSVYDVFKQKQILDPVTIQANFVYLKNVDAKISDLLRRSKLNR